MLSQKQKEWVDHLSNDSKVKIVPFDPSSREKFEKIKIIIQSKLGKETKVEHRGASSFGISGQDEIDVYIPVPPSLFNNYVFPLTELFGKPRSSYPLERARFVASESGKHADIFLVNKESESYLDGLKFENYLRTHPEILEEYRLLKESGNGISTRDYYRRKIEFINFVIQSTV